MPTASTSGVVSKNIGEYACQHIESGVSCSRSLTCIKIRC
jgi:hypothetical protein